MKGIYKTFANVYWLMMSGKNGVCQIHVIIMGLYSANYAANLFIDKLLTNQLAN